MVRIGLYTKVLPIMAYNVLPFKSLGSVKLFNIFERIQILPHTVKYMKYYNKKKLFSI